MPVNRLKIAKTPPNSKSQSKSVKVLFFHVRMLSAKIYPKHAPVAAVIQAIARFSILLKIEKKITIPKKVITMYVTFSLVLLLILIVSKIPTKAQTIPLLKLYHFYIFRFDIFLHKHNYLCFVFCIRLNHFINFLIY